MRHLAIALLFIGPAAFAGTLDVNLGARHEGVFGLEVGVEGAPAYVCLGATCPSAPAGTPIVGPLRLLNEQFYFDPTRLVCDSAPCELEISEVRSDDSEILRISILDDGSQRLLQVETQTESASRFDSWPIDPLRWTRVQVRWSAATAPGVSDGQVDVWIDISGPFSMISIQNSLEEAQEFRLGHPGTNVGFSGSIDFDDFELTGGGDISSTSTSHLVTIAKLGAGDGVVTSTPAGIDCGVDCDEDFPVGTTVTLAAAADPFSEFAAWGGEADCFDGVLSVYSRIDCTATFDVGIVGHLFGDDFEEGTSGKWSVTED